jgi:8-hydroxy-5-deazaflavin:NADPH oxidoreductase
MKVIAVIGGTGNLGRALAQRWIRAGYDVIIGSRDASRAMSTAADLEQTFGRRVRGADYVGASRDAEVVVVAVPFASQTETLAAIREGVAGKIVIDTTVPLMPPKVMRVQLPAEGCAAVRAHALLGENVSVVSAFHNVSAGRLATDDAIDCDVLVFGDKRDARQVAVDLAAAAGLRGLHAGVLSNSAAAEALTSVLIFLNKYYSVDGAGIRVSGELSEPAAA